MAESRIKAENYITIQGWMVTELGLRNNRLLLYALLYGFSQDGKSGYSGKQDYLLEWLDCSRSALKNYIKELKGKGLLREVSTNTGQKLLQALRFPICANSGHDGQKMAMECANSGLLPIYNNIHNTINSDSVKGNFTPPTVEEVENYCRERKNGIDPQRFVDYYTAQKWVRNGQPIDDWQLIIRLWETNGRDDNKPGKPAEKHSGGSFDTDEFFEAALKRTYGES